MIYASCNAGFGEHIFELEVYYLPGHSECPTHLWEHDKPQFFNKPKTHLPNYEPLTFLELNNRHLDFYLHGIGTVGDLHIL